MTWNEGILEEFTPLKESKYVSLGNGYEVKIKGIGSVRLSMELEVVKLQKVLYVPELSSNLFSVPTTVQKGNSVEFKGTICYLLNTKGKLCGIGRKIKKLYELKCKVCNQRKTEKCQQNHVAYNLEEVSPRRKTSSKKGSLRVDVGKNNKKKSKLEKMVSDLIKTNERNFEEIAALKMEINQLKKTVEEMKISLKVKDKEELSATSVCAKDKKEKQRRSKKRIKKIEKLKVPNNSLKLQGKDSQDVLQCEETVKLMELVNKLKEISLAYSKAGNPPLETNVKMKKEVARSKDVNLSDHHSMDGYLSNATMVPRSEISQTVGVIAKHCQRIADNLTKLLPSENLRRRDIGCINFI